MSVTQGRAWNSQTVASATVTSALLGQCRRVVLVCDSASAASLRVSIRNKSNSLIDNTHQTAADAMSEYFVLAAGASIEFKAPVDNPIVQLLVAGNGGTATFSGTVTEP